jgi:[ribosomal protein S5]-alanine N-acetyltransferase
MFQNPLRVNRRRPKLVRVLETARLLLLRPRLADATDLLVFLGDADAMRYTHCLASLHACRRHIAGHEWQRRKRGYGPWTVREKRSERIIGFGGLYDDPFEPGWGAEVGYHFAPAAWGHGYATELTRYCLAVAAERLSLSLVKAFAHPDNVASRRVLEKAGFVEQRFVPAMNRYLFAATLSARETPQSTCSS